MSSEHEILKKRYADDIIRRINENPQAFLDMDSPSERRGRYAKAKPQRVAAYRGRFAPQAKPSETQKAIGAGLYEGFTFSAGDEISAAKAAVQAWLDDRDASSAYDEELKRARAEASYLQEQHPIAYGGGAIVGALAQPVTYVPAGWVGRGAALASNAGKAANLATRSASLAKVGAIDGGVYGFNSGTGGLGNRLRTAGKAAAIGATVAGTLPGAGHLAAKAADPVLDRLVTPIAKRITQDPREIAILLEKARTMRLVNPNHSEADLTYILKTLYDSPINKGRKTTDDLAIMHKALYEQGLGNAQISTTRDRINKIGEAYVGAGYRSDGRDYELLSADGKFQYRRPKVKKNPHPSAKSNVQANLERDRKNREVFHHNLHVDIFD